jgi:pyruvate carboxylase
VRNQYAPSKATSRGRASEVYLHEMPGGQFTNLKEQARSLGLESRWHQVAQTYADANQMFGDIVKVTPSSKVVGDMALMMVSQDLTAPTSKSRRDIAFPDSVVGSMLPATSASRRAAGRQGLQKKALKGDTADRPAARLAAQAADLEAERKEGRRTRYGQRDRRRVRLVPDVSEGVSPTSPDAGQVRPVSVLPTPTYFYGLKPKARSFSSTSRRARPWSFCYQGRRARPTTRAWCGSSSS